jgi:hypothetical protein
MPSHCSSRSPSLLSSSLSLSLSLSSNFAVPSPTTHLPPFSLLVDLASPRGLSKSTTQVTPSTLNSLGADLRISTPSASTLFRPYHHLHHWCHLLSFLFLHLTSLHPTDNSPMFSHFPSGTLQTTIKAVPLPSHYCRLLAALLIHFHLSQYSLEPSMPFPLLLCTYLYSTHQFTTFCPYHTNGDNTKLLRLLP